MQSEPTAAVYFGSPSLVMLAFAPIHCNFLDVDPNSDFQTFLSAVAYWQKVLPYQGGPPKPQVVHCGFRMRQPGSGETVYTRSFLIVKLALFRAEWERRHAFFQEVGGTERGATEDTQCHEGCRLKGKPGRHLKNDIEEEWERAAADTYTEFARRLNRLASFEEAFVHITGFSPHDSSEFTPDTLPLGLFQFPSVPGPDEPPTDRIDTQMHGTDLKSELRLAAKQPTL